MKLHCILTACLVWLFVEVPVTESQIAKTFQSVESFTDSLNRGEFITVVQNIVKTITPYMGNISSVVKQIVANKPSSNQANADLKYLRQLSENINQKLDDVMSHLSEIKNLIRWTAIKNTYATYESNIIAAHNRFKNIFKESQSKMNRTIKLFIQSYKHYSDSGIKLYNGFIGDHNQVFTEGFLRPAINYTENNRGQMRTFMLSVLKLLLMAADVELGYLSIKGYDISDCRQEWKDRFKCVQDKMEAIDLELKSNYLAQSNKDIDKFSKNNLELSNPLFGRNLYQELSKKYFWRDWLVVVSTHTEGFHDAYSLSCNGVVKSFKSTVAGTVAGKDLVIDSVEKNTTNSDILTNMKLRCTSLRDSCKTTTRHYTCSDHKECLHYGYQCVQQTFENADVVFNWITNVRNCSFSSYGVIDTHKDPVYYAGPTFPTDDSPNRLFVCDLEKCNYFVHFFA